MDPLSSRGTYSLKADALTYAGRMILLDVMSSSILWALQPTTLDMANSGVYISWGMSSMS